MKVAIITEGLQGTGYGHLTRCLSVYQAFEEKGILPLYIANCDEKGKSFVSDANLIQLDWVNDNEKLIALIKDFDIAIIDSYLAPIETYTEISNAVNKAAYFDDYMRLDYPAGFLVNGAVGAENLPYKKNDKHKLLIGIDYSPLRKAFWDVKIPSYKKDKIKNVFINFGGQDNKNLTNKILKYLLKEFPSLKYKVVYGIKPDESYKNDSIDYYYGLTDEEMLKLMLECDLAVTAAGQTIYELARVGIPTIAIGTADNQEYNLSGWVKRGFLKTELWADQNDLLDKLKIRLDELIVTLTTKKKVFCDGQGVRRILNHLLTNSSENKFFLRKFVKDDIIPIFNLSNDDEVRAVSINQSKISWEDHQRWFYDRLGSSSAYYLTALTLNQELIGQIKFDIKNEMPVISISISKDFRGKGLAVALLRDACNLFYYTHPEQNKIIAYISEDNTKSVRSFDKIGFIFKGQKQINNKQFDFYILNKKSLNDN
jgi:spore coat polysaccharide biosynthesis predicted glycosyltransferase SpsG/RimJ/RimL family protein N-acetyltransferase